MLHHSEIFIYVHMINTKEKKTTIIITHLYQKQAVGFVIKVLEYQYFNTTENQQCNCHTATVAAARKYKKELLVWNYCVYETETNERQFAKLNSGRRVYSLHKSEGLHLIHPHNLQWSHCESDNLLFHLTAHWQTLIISHQPYLNAVAFRSFM